MMAARETQLPAEPAGVAAARPAPAGGRSRPLFLAALLAVTATVCAVDQLTKWIAGAVLAGGRPVELLPGLLELRLRANPHGAFGLFAGFPPGLRQPVLLGLALLAMTAISVYAIRTLGLTRPVAIALGLVLGGALANASDRLARGEVLDFIHLYWADAFHWPTFNLADVAITCGSLLLAATVIRLWFRRSRSEEAGAV